LFIIFVSLFFWVELGHIVTRQVDKLSGGELQRFAIAVACISAAEM